MSYKIRRAKPEDAHDIARVQVAGWHSTYTGLMPESVLANQTVELREPMWTHILAEPERFAVYVATVKPDEVEEIVGIVSGGPPQDAVDGWYDGFDAAVYALYVLKEHQGSGVGRALLEKMLTHFASAGKSAMLLWVLDQNHHARGFYERLGGTLLEHEILYPTDEKQVREVAYGWYNLQKLNTKANKEKEA
jgi:ribosomal protein S18 acetylase RimI-like enzyme